ncbi:MAG: hypothetical protein FJY07_03125 [Bacteroidetes bacterium]|nr:hypothetical protein [Bacteroidota bacterium]
MGYLESAVVVYLRRIYYPEGFDFPLKAIEPGIGLTEILREAATLVMLAGAGILTGRTKTEKFGFFLYCFAVWDIFYYIFLKLLLGWPSSLLTWDILFLIPVTWVGPVIGPVINSLTMISLALLISHFTDKSISICIAPREWMLLTAGSLVMIVAYTWDYMRFMLGKYELSDFFSLTRHKEMLDTASGYMPAGFPWWLYVMGELLLVAALVLFAKRNIRVA